MHALFLYTIIFYAFGKVHFRNLKLCCVSRCDKRPVSLPVVVEGRHVLRIDATVAKNLALLLSDLEAREQKIIFWNWCEDARQTLISYDPSLATYCRSSASIAQIFSGKLSVTRFAAFSRKKTACLQIKLEVIISFLFKY